MERTNSEYEGLSDAELEAIRMLYGVQTGSICIIAFRRWLEQNELNKLAFIRIGEALRCAQSNPSLLDDALLAFLPSDGAKH